MDLLTGYPFQSQYYVQTPGTPRLLRGDNVAQGRLRWDGAQHWPAEMLQGLEEYRLERGDVILAMDRPWIEAGLKYAAISDADGPALLVQRVARLRGHRDLRTDFLRYVIGAPPFTNYILGVQTGTSIPHISPSQIRDYTFALPSVEEQYGIATLLGALDKKTELNRQMNETLEATARALFKSWFVDFDPVRAKMAGRAPFGMDSATAALFPSEVVAGLPAGWRKGRLEELQADEPNAITAGPFGSNLVRADYVESGVPVIRGQNLAGLAGEWFREDEFVYVTEEKVERDLRSCIARRGDVVFTQRGTLGQAGIIPFNSRHSRYVVSQSQMKMTCHRDVPAEYVFLLFKQPETVAYIHQNAVAVGVPHINLSFLRSFPALIVQPPILAAFADVVRPLQRRMFGATEESRTLAELRDLLLPKLLSGELRIRDAEKAVEAVI